MANVSKDALAANQEPTASSGKKGSPVPPSPAKPANLLPDEDEHVIRKSNIFFNKQ